MRTRFTKRGVAKLFARVCAVGLFGCVMSTQAGAASADDSAAYAAITTAGLGGGPRATFSMTPVLPSAVRAVRTPHQPPPPPPPAALNVSVGKVVYLKSHHRNPVMQFTIKLSKPVNKQVRVAYSTAANDPSADGEFKNVTGEAIIHAGNVNFTVRVPITGPVNVANGAVVLSLVDPMNAVIGNGQNLGLLTPGVASPKKH